MMIIHHKNREARGVIVLAGYAFHFKDGVAEAGNLNAAVQVALWARGHRIEEAPGKPRRKPVKAQGAASAAAASASSAAESAATAATAEKSAARAVEIGADVEITEERPPEIG